MTDEYYMSMALFQAQEAAAEGEVPIGAVIVGADGSILAAEHNRTEALHDVTAHAEMLAIGAAASVIGAKYLTDCTLYVTFDPTPTSATYTRSPHNPLMIILAADPKRGYTTMYAHSPFHPRAVVLQGILADECAAVITDFFRRRR